MRMQIGASFGKDVNPGYHGAKNIAKTKKWFEGTKDQRKANRSRDGTWPLSAVGRVCGDYRRWAGSALEFAPIRLGWLIKKRERKYFS
jgi:hypothetical protein